MFSYHNTLEDAFLDAGEKAQTEAVTYVVCKDGRMWFACGLRFLVECDADLEQSIVALCHATGEYLELAK